jgi:hypothetical protein
MRETPIIVDSVGITSSTTVTNFRNSLDLLSSSPVLLISSICTWDAMKLPSLGNSSGLILPSTNLLRMQVSTIYFTVSFFHVDQLSEVFGDFNSSGIILRYLVYPAMDHISSSRLPRRPRLSRFSFCRRLRLSNSYGGQAQ